MVRLRKKGNTSVVENHTRVLVTFYQTLIFSWYKTMGSIVLNNGGHWTATTKLRINQCFQEYNLPYHLFRRMGTGTYELLIPLMSGTTKTKAVTAFP